MNIKFLAYLSIAFLLIATTVYSAVSSLSDSTQKPMLVSIVPKEKPSPYDWVKEEQIYVLGDRVIINVRDAEWATFTDTNSMDPIIDIGANAIQIIPQSEEDIHTGDIVSYQSKISGDMLIHRVVDIREDEDGTYYTVRGDNNTEPDPEKVRFSQIKRVLIAIIY